MTDAEFLEYRRHVAVHEAAHAVVGGSLGLDVVGILIECEATSCGGYTVFTDGTTSEPVETMSRHPEMMGPTLFAGSLAEQELLGSHIQRGYSIDTDIFSKGLPLTNDVSGAVKTAKASARGLVAQHREAILKLADRLMEIDHLMGDELQTLLR